MISSTTRKVLNRMFRHPIDLSNRQYYIREITIRLNHEQTGFASESVGFSIGNSLRIEELEESILELNYIDEQEYMKPFMY